MATNDIRWELDINSNKKKSENIFSAFKSPQSVYRRIKAAEAKYEQLKNTTCTRDDYKKAMKQIKQAAKKAGN